MVSLVLEGPWEHMSLGTHVGPLGCTCFSDQRAGTREKPLFYDLSGVYCCLFETFPLKIPKEKPFQPPTLYLVGGGPFLLPWNWNAP